MSKDEDYIKSNMTILYAKCDFLSVNVSSVNKGIIFLELLKWAVSVFVKTMADCWCLQDWKVGKATPWKYQGAQQQ